MAYLSTTTSIAYATHNLNGVSAMGWIAVLAVVTVAIAPLALTIILLWAWRRWQDRDGRRSPIANRPIYGAGEQLRKRVEDLGDEITAGTSTLVFLGPYFLAIWALHRLDWTKLKFGFGDYLFVVAFTVMSAGVIWKILRHGKRRRIANAGLKAELYTAQEINRLVARGCTVLHDIPGDQFNIDHVVIGPCAVFAIETKSVRKPPANKSKDHFKVTYDGKSLRFPDFSDTKRLQQTKRQADWLAAYLRQAIGRSIQVRPALALPGWWIDRTGSQTDSDVRVFNPAGKGADFMADRAGSSIDVSMASLIAHALVMRYPADQDR